MSGTPRSAGTAAMASRFRSNIRLGEASDRYIQRITNEGQSETSVRTARYALARFKKTVATRQRPDPYLHEITPEQLDDYCYGPGGIREGIAAISFNRYRSVLKLFFEYAMNMRWCDLNPMDGITPARPDTPKTRLILSANELLALLDNASNPIERVALSVGMNTGLRGNDIRRLTIFDVSLSSGVIQTEIRKTRKLDIKPITMDLQPELIRWLDLYAEYMGLEDRGQLPNEWLLVPSYRNPAPREKRQHVHPRPTLVHTKPWLMVKRPLERIGYPTKGEGFHTLRRSSARALFEILRASGEGRDHALMIVKDFLNHASVTQTELYLGLNQERALRDALLKDQPFLSRLAQTEQARINGVHVRGA
ncbi:MAG: tyrosine-type recombinase/integrase [Mycobacteriaceae bacterium]